MDINSNCIGTDCFWIFCLLVLAYGLSPSLIIHLIVLPVKDYFVALTEIAAIF